MPLRICCTENHERRPWRTRRSRSSLSVARAPPGSAGGAQARFDLMGLARLGLEISNLCDSLYSILLLNVILGLDFLGCALSRPQVIGQPAMLPSTPRNAHATRYAEVRAILFLDFVVY